MVLIEVPEATKSHEKLEELEEKEPVISLPELTVADVRALAPLTVKVNAFKFIIEPLLNVKAAMLRLASKIGLLLTSGTITVVPLVGTPEGDQLPESAQSVEMTPVHVEVDCALRPRLKIEKTRKLKRKEFFINFRYKMGND